jgi:NADPH:quinone reductase-like Zn-dependent oxidoreductase
MHQRFSSCARHPVPAQPVYTDFEDPICRANEVLIDVTAAALTHFVKLRAAGKHYSFYLDPPFVVGIDGVGKLADGRGAPHRGNWPKP